LLARTEFARVVGNVTAHEDKSVWVICGPSKGTNMTSGMLLMF
jgi:hypothetical protein